MNRLLCGVILIGIAPFPCVPVALAGDPTAEDYVQFWKPLAGSWKVTNEFDGKAHPGTWSYQLAPNGKSYLVYSEGGWFAPTHQIERYDPASKKWAIVQVLDDGSYMLATLEIPGMTKGRMVGKGVIGTWEEKRHGADGKLIASRSTLSCTEIDENRHVYVYSNITENGKPKAGQFKMVLERQKEAVPLPSDSAQAQEARIPREILKELEYLVGEWKVEGEFHGEKTAGEFSVKWAPARHCLLYDCIWTSEKGKVCGSSIIAWDAATKEIVDVWFNSRGGAGALRYKVQSPTLMAGQSRGVDENGKAETGNISMEKKGPNAFVWKETSQVSGAVTQLLHFRRTSGDPVAADDGPTAEDYIQFWKPILGAWKWTDETGGKVTSGTVSFELAPNQKCILTRLEGPEGRSCGVDGYDPAAKKWTMTQFGSDGGYWHPTLDFARSPKGRALGDGVIGRWEHRQTARDGSTTIGTSTMSCAKASANQCVIVWSDGKENGKPLPESRWTLNRIGIDKAAASSAGASPAHEHLKPLEWMIGDWVGEYVATFDLGEVKKGDRVTTRGSTRWMLDRTFLVQDFEMEINGRKVPDTHEIIGWDPAGKKVVHWIYSPFGAGAGQWTQVGDKPVLRWWLDTKDGKLEGTSVSNKLDADTSVWQAKDITLAGRKTPDWPEVTYRRKKGESAGNLWKAFRDAVTGTWEGTGTLGQDNPDTPFVKGDRFTYSLIWKPDPQGRVLTGEGTFRVPGKDHDSTVRSLLCWDPETRQIHLLALWSNGLVEEGLIGVREGTAFLGTYVAKSPGHQTVQAAIRYDVPSADSLNISFLDGPRKGQVLSSWKRKR